MPYQKFKRGIIPLFILIAVGIVFAAAGGAYIVRKEFVKTGKSGKTALDVEKVKQQIANPTPLPSPSPNSPKEYATGPFTYTPASPSPGSKTSSVPAFTISPPSGWLKGQTSVAIVVSFDAPEEDEENGEEGLKVTSRATVSVQLQDLKENVSTETLVSALKERAQGEYEKVEFLSETKITLSGQKAYILESKFFRKGFWTHSFDYIMVKDTYAVVISGVSSDSASSKWSGAMKGSIETFALKN